MKRYIFLLTCILPVVSWSQGTLLESKSLQSEILQRSVEYSIYLPEGYEFSQRHYPVLYLLHGYSDDETGWTQFGEVQKIADGLTDDIDVTPMVIVMPDAGVDWYINSYDDKTRYEDFFIEEFVQYIENTYRVRIGKQFRAVAGLSMGGHGTLVYAMKHPEMFAAAAPLSAAVWEEEEITSPESGNWDRWFGFIFGPGLQGEERLTPHLRNNTALFLAANVPVDELNTVNWYIDCGDDDFLVNGNMALHKMLNERGVEHEFRIRDGGHNWTYWREALPEVLRFVSKRFHR